MSDFFYNLGRNMGRKSLPALRKGKWIWSSLTGSEEEALRAEIELGKSMAVELRAVTEPSSDPESSALVNALSQRLSACVRDKRRTFHCEVIRETYPNAIALPGGFVFLSHTLLQLCERNPDELAFVIAHEMAHILEGHAWDRMLNDAALKMFSTVASRAGAAGGWLQQKGMLLLRSAFSQDSEREADRLGIRHVIAAGFDPVGAVRLFQRLESLVREQSELGQYFASHPAPAERSARVLAMIRKWQGGQT